MSFESLIIEIESHPFVLRAMLASDIRTFVDGIALEPKVIDLVNALSMEPHTKSRLFAHILELTKQRTDVRYRDPHDVPLAVYLWMLNAIDPSLAQLAAQLVCPVPRCWWAAKMSHQILFGQPLSRDAGRIEDSFGSLAVQFSTANSAIERLTFTNIPSELAGDIAERYSVSSSAQGVQSSDRGPNAFVSSTNHQSGNPRT